jgi:Winged helix-turn helix
MVAIAVTRTDLTLVELRAAARRASDSKQARRILAIAMVLDGYSREAAAQACGMDRQTLRDWGHRYNEAGLKGLADRARSGCHASLTQAEEEEVAAEISKCVAAGAIAVLVIDGAGWHSSSTLILPDNIVLLTLPPMHPS